MRHTNSLKSLAAGLAAVSVLAAAGCGSRAAGVAADATPAGEGLAPGGAPAQVFTAQGMRQILVKTKGGVGADSLPGGVRPVRRLAGLGLEVVGVPAGADFAAALSALRQDPRVVSATPNFVKRAILPTLDLEARRARALAPTPDPGPNDPRFGEQYAPQLVQAPAAWHLSEGRGVTIAIVDTGVDVSHPDLKAHVVPGHAVADASPTLSPPEQDDNGHGTHCAGIAAALANNATGIVGVAPGARIMPVKVLSGEGSGSDAGVAEGIVWAADHGANVISLSLGGPEASPAIDAAVAHAIAKGAVVVAAMGNDGNGEKSFPAAVPGVIAVGASDRRDRKAGFSQFGAWISVAAPGVDILSTFPTYRVALNNEGFPQNYASLDGTSMATPAAAGVVGLIRAKFPALTPAQVKARLESSAEDKGERGFDQFFGHGRVQALKALS